DPCRRDNHGMRQGTACMMAALRRFDPRRIEPRRSGRRAVSTAQARAMLTVGLVGPLPPPAGGMAMQCVQLRQLLESEGIGVVLVQTNAPYRPHWIGRLRGARALFRLIPYLADLWAM